MALIAWYPLNGDTKDYSGRNQDILTSVTATVDNNGKIGKCYSFAAGQRIMQSDLSFPRTTSTTMWAYATSLPPSMLFSYNNAYGPDLYFTDNSIHWNLGDGNAYPFKKAGVNVAQPSLNTWYHYTVINDEESQKCYLYIDGDYYGETAWRSTYQTNTGFTIGNYVPVDTGYAWRGKINDVRIYDHALSKKEIKEISKAKILHYTFDDFQEPTENLLPSLVTAAYSNWGTNTGTSTIFTSPTGRNGVYLNVTSFTNGGVNWYNSGDSFNTSPSTQYMVSAIVKSTANFSENLFYLRQYRSDGSQITEGGQYSSSYRVDLGNGWYKAYRAFTTSSECTKFLIHGYQYSSGEFWIYDLQVEKKPYYTDFILPQSSREGIVRDISGYRNDAALNLTTTPQWTENSKIGSGAYKFRGNNTSLISVNNNWILPQYTISFWAKHELEGKMPIGSCGATRNTNFYWYGDSSWKYIHGGVSGEYYYTKNANIPLNTWGHYCVTYDGANVKIYRNGIYEGSKASTGTANFTTGFSIGYGYSTTSSDFNGNIDDVRIYATALSASDILDLYRTRMTVDNKGALSEGLIVEDITRGTAKNLILNGDGSLLNSSNFPGMTYVPNTDLPGVKGVFQTTDRWQDVAFTDFIPINSSDSYSIGVSARKLGAASLRTVFYLTIKCYDANYKIIQNGHTNIINPACNTTLAVELVDGATTVTVTNGSAWAALQPGSSPWVNIAFATHAAYDGYAYLPKYAGVASISGNTITLENPWNQGTVKVGTKTTATREGSTYEYPVIANLDTIWTSYTRKATFRPGTQYVKIGLLPNLGEDQATIQAGGFFLYNDSRPQRLLNTSQFSLSEKGILNTQELFEVGLPVRYIRDSINGNSRNNSNHWSLIRAFNRIGTNVAIGATVIAPTTVYPPSVYGAQVVINDTVATSPYIEGGNYCLIDLGQIIDIVSIGVWHYYGDVRTYNDNILEVSTDGINWITVYSNEGKEGYVESEVGNQVILYNKNVNINNKGEIYTETLREVF